jgi:pimeloyl-ACP methyl ester carboxylesterase
VRQRAAPRNGNPWKIVMNTSAMFYARDSKPTVIALHCSGASGQMWRHLSDALGDRFALIAPDLIGCGAAGPWRGARVFSAADEAALTVGMIDTIDAPVHLVGHSYGGGVALRVARECASRLASLTLYEPSLVSVLNTMGDEGRAALAEIGAAASQVIDGMSTGAYLAAARIFVNYWNGDGSWDAMSPEAQAGVARHVPKLCLEYRAMSRERVPLQAYRRFNFPVLLLQGERSLQPAHLIVRQLHRAMKSATLHTVYGAAHMGPLTHPAAVNALMVDHISRAEQADPTVEQFLPIEKRLAA